jgi:cysteine desulfuration protein SufE
LRFSVKPDTFRTMSVSCSNTSESAMGQRLAALLEIRDPQARLARLVEEARHRPALPDAQRVEVNRVTGCLVRIWFVAEFREGRCFFQCDSDAVSLKAVGGLLCELHSERTPEEILATGEGVLRTLNILHQLAENRQRTIMRIEEQIRGFAQEQGTKGT